MSINSAPTALRPRRAQVDRAAGDVAAATIRTIAADLHRSRLQLIRAVAAYDLTGHWALSAPTCAHWIATELGMTTGTAREWLRVGHAMRALAEVDRAFEHGRLSYAKVRELTRVAIDHPDRQAELIELAEKETANDLGRALAEWSAQFETPEERDERHQRERGLWCHVKHDGMGVITIRLPPLAFGSAMAAIDARVMTTQRGKNVPAGTSSSPSAADAPSFAQRRSDAVLDLLTNGGASITTEIILHVRGDGCTLDDGTPVTGSTVERIASESFIRTMIHDAESHPINVSGRHRFPTDRQRRLVHERDRRCVDCGGTSLLHVHHEPPFEVTEQTVVDELRLECAICHRKIHDEDGRWPTKRSA